MDYAENMKHILKFLTRKNIHVTVVTIPPILKFGKYGGTLTAANDSVKIVAANYPGTQQFSNKK